MEARGSAGRHIGCSVAAAKVQAVDQAVLASRNVRLERHSVFYHTAHKTFVKPRRPRDDGVPPRAARRASSSREILSVCLEVASRGCPGEEARFRAPPFARGASARVAPPPERGALRSPWPWASRAGLAGATFAAFASIFACIEAARRRLNASSSSKAAASSSVGSTGCDRLAAGAASSSGKKASSQTPLPRRLGAGGSG